MSLIILSIYIIFDGDASWHKTLDDTLSSLNTLYSSRNSADVDGGGLRPSTQPCATASDSSMQPCYHCFSFIYIAAL